MASFGGEGTLYTSLRPGGGAWGRWAPNLPTAGTHGHQLFFRGGEEYLKKGSTPQNGSRGGVKFGVTEGEKGGGDKRKFSPQLRTTLKNLRLFFPFWALF